MRGEPLVHLWTFAGSAGRGVNDPRAHLQLTAAGRPRAAKLQLACGGLALIDPVQHWFSRLRVA